MDAEELQVWQAKLAAWLHDPPEKALILSRTKEGHEGGTVARLYEYCFGSEQLGPRLRAAAHLADTWAAAADRPQWLRPKEDKHFGQGIRFWSRSGAELVHPLSGDRYHLPDLYVDSAGRIVHAAGEKMQEMLQRVGESDDPEAAIAVEGAEPLLCPEDLLNEPVPAELGKEEGNTANLLRRAVLTLWRFGPVSDPKELKLGTVWRLLPADSRVPDHSIWEHLGLASAFAGARAADKDGNPALLVVTLGPVQGFIEQARSTSDLWAGSHLLSCLAWEAMKVVVERYGPDAVIFPNLWGVPLVDVWLREQGVVFPAKDDPRRPAWLDSPTDSNPLFSPCLPNRFVALVSADRAQELGQQVQEHVRQWVRKEVEATAEELCGLAEVKLTNDARAQIAAQLADFPEVYWVAVPFAPLVDWQRTEGRHGPVERVTAWTQLEELLGCFYPGGQRPGFFASQLWKLLEPKAGSTMELELHGADAPLVYTPNPGVLYTALRELGDRTVAAVKATRTFAQTRQEGYRCTVCGEREWLRGPGDNEPPEKERGKASPLRTFELPRGQRGDTLWTKLASSNQVPLRAGEHLCALCAWKRLWPRRFAVAAQQWAELPKQEGEEEKIRRYVVSTHTMAIAADLADLPPRKGPKEADRDFKVRQKAFDELCALAKDAAGCAVLPKKLADELAQKKDEQVCLLARRLPEMLEKEENDTDEQTGKPQAHPTGQRAHVAALWRQAVGHTPEAYYGLILMDGDGMGRWLSGDHKLMLRLEELWHPELVQALARRYPGADEPLRQLLESPRPSSPAYHAALSGAMNAFALRVARWVVEELFYGRLIYSGGDDVLAMVTVDDLLPCLFALRCAFSGIVPAGEKEGVEELYRHMGSRLGDIDKGYVRLHNRLYRMLGGRMTASAGAVVAHHTAPLQAVLRRLREAEKTAKANGRNSFAVVVSKRGGGESTYVASWGFGGTMARDGQPAEADLAVLRDVPYVPDRWADATAGLITPIGALLRLRNTLALPFVSRRAVYHTLEWLQHMPSAPAPDGEADYREMLVAPLAWQLERQGVNAAKYRKEGYAHLLPKDGEPARRLAEALVDVGLRQCRPYGESAMWRSVPEHLHNLLITAEFLARQGRAPEPQPAATPATTEGGEA
jgi:CRISPR-associated protein Cmr2